MVIINAEQFEALIFDLDGVVTQTASIHAQAWKRLFDEFLAFRATAMNRAFVPFDQEKDYQRYVDGKSRIAGVASFLGSRNITIPAGEPGDQAEQATLHGLAKRKDQYFSALLAGAGVEVSTFAKPLLKEARRRGMHVAVASSSHHCVQILHSAGLAELFDARVDGIELDQLGISGKPAPDIFLEAARRLSASPVHTVVFEDALAGVEAARAGGFGLVIGVGSSARAPGLLKHGADKVVADLDEIRLEGRRSSVS